MRRFLAFDGDNAAHLAVIRLSALLAMDSEFANGALDLRGGNEQRLRGLVEGVASRLVLCGIAPEG